jgi:hypothetical protein
LGSQAPANNLRRFSALHSTNLKNRTGIGSHPAAGKNQQIQAPLTGYVRSSEIIVHDCEAKALIKAAQSIP